MRDVSDLDLGKEDLQVGGAESFWCLICEASFEGWMGIDHMDEKAVLGLWSGEIESPALVVTGER